MTGSIDKDKINVNWEIVIKEIRELGSTKNSFEQYDPNWIITILSACLENINRYFLPTEIETLGENLSQEEISLLIKIVNYLKDGNYYTGN